MISEKTRTKMPAAVRKRIGTARTSALLIRLTPDALAALRREAHDLDFSMSQLVARAVAEWLRREVERVRDVGAENAA